MFTVRPAIREDTPLIIGLAGPTKSGKTYSAHRLARGIVGPDGVVAMLNAEGKRGHQYADKFKYLACDISAPYSYERYEAAIEDIAKAKPDIVIIDSMSHAHDGPGGMIEQHDAELDRMAGTDYKKRERATWAAWIKPKQSENRFIYRLIDDLKCPVILCFRAKEKLKIVPGKEPIDLGWRPIASEKIQFETMFTLVLPPFSKGVPDMAVSEMREPFDAMIKAGVQLDEELGARLAAWSRGRPKAPPAVQPPPIREPIPHAPPADPEPEPEPQGPIEYVTPAQREALRMAGAMAGIPYEKLLAKCRVAILDELPANEYAAALAWIERQPKRAPPP